MAADRSQVHGGVVEGLRAEGTRLGFSQLGVCDAGHSPHLEHYREWLAAGYHGEMGYLGRADSVSRRGDLASTLEGVRSVVVVAHEYAQPNPDGVPQDPSRGVVARYARGDDYHDVVLRKLEALGSWLAAEVDGLRHRAYVDTGPILERDLAQRAGLGWFGKNTLLIHPARGSYFFLGILLVDVDLPADEPFDAMRCGTCSACLEACPTGALLGVDEKGAPVMDARRCISYLTIELKGSIPVELRPLMGNRVFGCDICQEVCPFPRKFSQPSTEPAYAARPDLDGPPLIELAERLLEMSGKGFQREFAGSPLQRAGRRGLLRNICVALGNWGDAEAVPVLASALSDSQPLVRGHAAWALGRVGSAGAREALSVRLEVEGDPFVREELGRALGV